MHKSLSYFGWGKDGFDLFRRPELAYQHSAAIKAVLYSVSIKGECSDYPDPIQAMKDGGSMLGELLKALLPVDRVFCESFASNLMIEFPNSSRRTVDQNESSMICKLAVISGNIAITVKDDTVRGRDGIRITNIID